MAKARWYASRGYPHTFIAAKLGVTRTTVRKWCVRYTSNRSFDRLVARIMKLSDVQRQTLVERITTRPS